MKANSKQIIGNNEFDASIPQLVFVQHFLCERYVAKMIRYGTGLMRSSLTFRVGPCLVQKKLQKILDFSSHQILRHMYGALNIDKRNN